MSGYVIANINVKNSEAYKEYVGKVKPIVEKFGGKYLTRGGHMEVILDELWSPTRMVLVKFPNLEKAKEWLNSPEYAEVAKMRLENSVGTFVLLEGF